MLGISLKVGEEVPIICRLYDRATDKFPQAVIRDDAGILLTTLDLSHESNGAYVPFAPYNMPDEDFIKVYFDVYNEVGHATLSMLHLSDMDIFKKVVPADYHADTSLLATEVNATTNMNIVVGEINVNETKIDIIITNIGNLNNLAIADVQTALTNQGYTVARAALLDNLSNLDMAISALNNLSQAGVQSAMTVQGYTTVRAALLDNLDNAISSVLAAIPANLADVPTDTELNAAHGAGSWLTGGGMSSAEHHTSLDSYANKNDWKAAITLLATELNATLNKNEIITEVNENESKIDAVGGIVTDIKTQTDKIPAMIIDLTFLKDIEGGNWERDGVQMIFRTILDVEVARFNLFKFDGSPAQEFDEEVAKRERI